MSRQKIIKKNKKVINSIFSLASYLTSEKKYNNLDIIITKTFKLSNIKSKIIKTKLIRFSKGKWEILLESSGLSCSDALDNLLKYARREYDFKNKKFTPDRILKTLKEDIEFWKRAKQADIDDASSKPSSINIINSNNEDDDKQLSFKFMEE